MKFKKNWAMRCISNGLIQKYIDKETSAKEDFVVQRHLINCSKCAERIEKKQQAANRIKHLISSLNTGDIQVPRFKEPEHKIGSFNIHLKKVIYTASAACLIFLISIFIQKPKSEVEIVYSYDIEGEYNANLPLSEQEMVIEIIDSKGKLIKY